MIQACGICKPALTYAFVLFTVAGNNNVSDCRPLLSPRLASAASKSVPVESSLSAESACILGALGGFPAA